MNDFERNFERYLMHLDLVKENEPEKYELIKEIIDSATDIELSVFIENIANSFEKHKKNYLSKDTKAGKEIFLREQIELYTYANHPFERNGVYSNATFIKYKPVFEEALEYWINESKKLKALPPQPIDKRKPKLNKKLITFKNSETIKKIHSELKGYFPNKEAELLKALQGKQLSEILLFPHNQNKFVEVFRRLKYNGFLLNTDTETKNWICATFQFVKKGFAEPQPFNESSVWDNLNKGKGEPTKKERICIVDWLPYKNSSQLARETKNEKL
ncbi:MAG: hypothetical protein J5I52_05740 [Saprospiraceae bacterium]|nr:MAG: hypothetical protein UZ09_BCD002000065 [Bacteroidetes bacterium OLB9]MCO6463633.1 hypothetical protein [Saprospiraceae bacterium]